VASAGNADKSACTHFPSSSGDVVSVAASTISDARASFSNYGTCVDLFAPGSSIRAAWLQGTTRSLSGTSMSSPHVAGVGALLMQLNPFSTREQIFQLMLTSSTKDVISSAQDTPNRLVYIPSTNTPPPATSSSQPSPPNGGARTVCSFVALAIACLLVL